MIISNKTQTSKWALAGLVIVIVLGAGLLIYWLYPLNFNDRTIPDSAELHWQGEITDKFYQVEIDHEVYYFEINSTINEPISSIGYWNSFNIGDYVYAFYFNDIEVITDNTETY